MALLAALIGDFGLAAFELYKCNRHAIPETLKHGPAAPDLLVIPNSPHSVHSFGAALVEMKHSRGIQAVQT